MPTTSKPNVTAQGHLDFGGPDFRATTYVHHAQNARARAALETWRTWPGGVFCLFGESGAGKSHLGSIWAQAAAAPTFEGASFDMATLAELTQKTPAVALIDHADLCDETALFGLLTHLEHKGGAILLLAQTPPPAWPYALKDLQSRLGAIACEALRAPETDLLAQLIIRQSAARGFKIDEAASTYLAQRIPRTFEATSDIVVAMQEVAAVTIKSPMALAQRALQALYKTQGLDEDVPMPDLFDL